MGSTLPFCTLWLRSYLIPQILDQAENDCRGTNALVYFKEVTKEKSCNIWHQISKLLNLSKEN